MKKLSLFLVSFLLFAIANSSYASTMYYFDFSGTVADGTVGSATMSIEISGNTLTAILDNTSPVNNVEEPAISGFGWNLNPETLGLNSWVLEAYDSGGVLTTIGDGDPTDEWIMDTTLAGINLDYLPTNGGTVDGALFNPLATGSAGLPGGINDVFFTTAYLTMTFDADIEGLIISADDYSPFVRMQAVGDGSDNSLKLPGTPFTPPTDPPGATVPEPGTMILLGFGLISLAGIGRRKIKK